MLSDDPVELSMVNVLWVHLEILPDVVLLCREVFEVESFACQYGPKAPLETSLGMLEFMADILPVSPNTCNVNEKSDPGCSNE